MMVKRGSILWLSLIALAALIGLGCRTNGHDQIKDNVAMPAPVVEKPGFIFHRVMPGETMATIAKWYSGKDSDWHEIAEHNPDLEPFKLTKDDIVKVPIYLAIVHKEQPSYSTAPKKYKKSRKTKDSGSTPEGPRTSEDEYFGPR